MRLSDEARKELEMVADQNDGLLKPRDVLDYARGPDTALHEHFEWDDSEAAERYRVEQARHIIMRVKVTLVGAEQKPVRVRTYVSNIEDRDGKTGYRRIVDVLQDDERRASMLRTAMMEFSALKKKWSQLSELAPIFRAIDKVVGVAESEGRVSA